MSEKELNQSTDVVAEKLKQVCDSFVKGLEELNAIAEDKK